MCRHSQQDLPLLLKARHSSAVMLIRYMHQKNATFDSCLTFMGEIHLQTDRVSLLEANLKDEFNLYVENEEYFYIFRRKTIVRLAK